MRLHKKLVVGFLVFSYSVAQAGPADLVPTPFTGTGIVTTALDAVGDHALPWTDSFGRTYSTTSSSPDIFNTLGIYLTNGDYTISGLGPNVTRVGVSWYRFYGAELSNVYFSNGDSYSVLTPLPDTNSWFGLQSNTPFTSVTFTISNNGSGAITDFTSQAVPEPSTIISSVICALFVGLVAFRKYRGRVLAQA